MTTRRSSAGSHPSSVLTTARRRPGSWSEWAPVFRETVREPSPESADSQGLQFAVKGRPLHADEFGGARDVAAEPADLSKQVFTLEDLARITQRQAHQLLAA